MLAPTLRVIKVARPLNITSFYKKTLFIHQNLLKSYELSVNTIFDLNNAHKWRGKKAKP